MTATRFILALLVLGTMAPDGYSQLLRRRREVMWRDLEPELERRAADVVVKAVSKGIREMFSDNGLLRLEFAFSIQVFAESQIDPELFKREMTATEGEFDQVGFRQMSKAVLEKGSAKIFLAETGRFAEKMKSDWYSAPVLRRMYLEYEVDGDSAAKDQSSGRNQPISQEIASRYSSMKGDQKEKQRSISCFESERPKDPKNKFPFTAHCSFVFTVQKDGKESEKTLSFDLNLEEMKPKEGSIVCPWKAANVKYK